MNNQHFQQVSTKNKPAMKRTIAHMNRNGHKNKFALLLSVALLVTMAYVAITPSVQKDLGVEPLIYISK